MNTCKINLVNKSIMGLLIWLVLVTGLVAAQTSTGAGKLTLNLQPSLDREGNIMATTITKAELLGTDGTVMVTGTIAGGAAQFNLSRIAPGDYFIRMNDLANNLVPTRIDDPTKAISQFVGQKLHVTVIGSPSDPTYLVHTFSKGMGEHPVVLYSDGTNDSPETYAYAILSLKTSPQKLEIDAIGTASRLNSFTPTMPTHPNTSTAINPAFSTWIFGDKSHAIDYNGTDNKCSACHVNMNIKPSTFSDVSTTNGWCFRCHYGKGGVDGFIDTTVISTPMPTTATSTATTAEPTPTSSTPAFEAFLAIAALLAVILVRRR